MVENELDEIISEPLLPDENRFTITSISVFLQDACSNIMISPSLIDAIDELDERIKKLEEKGNNGKDEGST